MSTWSVIYKELGSSIGIQFERHNLCRMKEEGKVG